jgi:gliding motility-associated-like protein
VFKKFLLLCVLLSSQIQFLLAQGYVGKDFYLASMEYYFNCYDTVNVNQGVYITSPHKANIKFITPTTLGPAYTATLSPNKAQYFKFSEIGYPLHFYDVEKISSFVAHITSDSDISVFYAIQTDSFKNYRTKGAAAILNTNNIPYGTEYMVTTNKQYKKFNCMGGSLDFVAPQMIILGIAPLSRIEFIPMAGSTASNDRILKPYFIELKQGETYSYVSKRSDLSGTIVRAKDSLSRFSVFAGDHLSGSSLPDSTGAICSSGDDYGIEQMLPTTSWAKSYTALPFKELFSGYYLKTIASQSNTRVYINGIYNRTLREGQHFTYNVTTQKVTRISADKPIFVSQFLKGGACINHSLPKFKLGDYEQINLTADTFSTTRGYISTLSKFDFWYGDTFVIPENYVNIICKTSDTASIFLNNKKIKNIEWKQSAVILGKSYAQIYLDSGTHELKSINPFNYYVYGYGDRHGHAYQGNSNTQTVNNNFVYDMGCKLDSVKFQALNTKDYYNFSWRFGDGSPTLSGVRAKHKYYDTGWMNTVLYFQHKSNNRNDSVTKRVYIAQAGPSDILVDDNNVFVKDTLVCGKLDLNVYVDNFSYDDSYLWSDKGTAYYKNFKLPGQYSIIIRETNTCTSFDTIRLSTRPKPTAVFNSTDTGFCENEGRAVTFFNKSYAVDTIVKNVWDFGVLDFENNDSVLTNNFNKAGQYLVKLRVTSKYGCWHDTFQQFTIYPSPHPKFDVVNLDSCFNSNQVTFINRTVFDTTLFQWYKWYFSEGYVISRSNPSGPRKYTAPGKYTANLIYIYNNGCFDTAKANITIYENPKTEFKLFNPAPCYGDSVGFVNLTSSSYSPLYYKWQFGDAKESLAKNPSHLYANKGQYSVKLVSHSPQYCSDSISKTIFLNGGIRADFKINDSLQCFDGHNFKLKNLSFTDSGKLVSSKWSFSDGSSRSMQDSVDKNFTTAGAYRIQLKVANSSGCLDSISKNVRVLNNPKGNIVVNQASQCENNQNFNFTFSPLYSGLNINSYHWTYNNDSSKGVANLNNLKFTPSGLQQVQLKTKSNDGCEALSIRYVSVNPTPVAKFDIPAKIQCFSGHAFQINNQSSISQGKIKNYNWDYGDGKTSNLQNPSSKSYSKQGNYLIELKLESDSACFASDTNRVYVTPKANIQIANIPNVCLNDSSVFKANYNGGKFISLRWEFGDANSSTAASPKHVYAKAGSYPVRLITSSGQNCIDTTLAASNALVWNLPVVDFKTTYTDGKNKNTFAKFTNTSRVSKTQDWNFESFGKSQLKDTTLNIKDSVTLKATLRISDYNGCFNSKTEYLFISGPFISFIPNVFTPNGDGINEGFGPKGIEFNREYKFTIYNRWGEIVFYTEDPNETWDGQYHNKLCPIGVYIYKIDLRDIYGRTHNLDGNFLMKY